VGEAEGQCFEVAERAAPVFELHLLLSGPPAIVGPGTVAVYGPIVPVTPKMELVVLTQLLKPWFDNTLRDLTEALHRECNSPRYPEHLLAFIQSLKRFIILARRISNAASGSAFLFSSLVLVACCYPHHWLRQFVHQTAGHECGAG
jgi:hypothetical protein